MEFKTCNTLLRHNLPVNNRNSALYPTDTKYGIIIPKTDRFLQAFLPVICFSSYFIWSYNDKMLEEWLHLIKLQAILCTLCT